MERQGKSSTYRIPTHRRDNRLPKRTHFGPVRQKVSLVHLSELLVLHLLDVCSRRKGFLGAGEDDGADRVVGGKGAEGGVELVEKHRIEGCSTKEGSVSSGGEEGEERTVERFGTVERDEGDAGSGRRDEDRGVLRLGKSGGVCLPAYDWLVCDPWCGEASGAGGGGAEEGGEAEHGRRRWERVLRVSEWRVTALALVRSLAEFDRERVKGRRARAS